MLLSRVLAGAPAEFTGDFGSIDDVAAVVVMAISMLNVTALQDKEAAQTQLSQTATALAWKQAVPETKS